MAQQLLGVTDVTADLERPVHARAIPRTEASIGQLADEVVRVLSGSRSTWNVHHVRAEAHRRARPIRTADRDALVERIVSAATDPTLSIRIQAPRMLAEAPEQRADGESVLSNTPRHDSRHPKSWMPRIASGQRGSAALLGWTLMRYDMRSGGVSMPAGS